MTSKLKKLNEIFTENGPCHIKMKPKELKKLSGQIRRSQKYLEWKQKVLDRDDLNLKSSNVHHRKAFKTILIENHITTLEDAKKCPELWDLKNGIVIGKGEHRILSLLERIKTITPGFRLELEEFLLGESKKKLLKEIAKGNGVVHNIEKKLKIKPSAIYQHVQELKREGYIEADKELKLTDLGRIMIL